MTAVEWRLDPTPPDVGGAVLGFGSLEALAESVPYLVALNPSAVEFLDATFLGFVGDAGADFPTALAGLLLVEFERDNGAAPGAWGDAVRGLKSLTATSRLRRSAGLEKLWASPAGLPPSSPSGNAALAPGHRGWASPSALARTPRDPCRGGSTRNRRCDVRHAGMVTFSHALPTRPAGMGKGLRALVEEVTALLVSSKAFRARARRGAAAGGVLERFYGPEVRALFRD